MLYILPGASTEANVGSHEIKLRLVDSDGEVSEWLTIILTIEVDSGTIEREEDTDIGRLFAQKLKKRIEQQAIDN